MVEQMQRLANAVDTVTPRWVRSRTFLMIAGYGAVTGYLLALDVFDRPIPALVWISVGFLSFTAWFGGKVWASLVAILPELLRAVADVCKAWRSL